MKKLTEEEAKEHRKQAVLKWKTNNPDLVLEYQRKYYETHREQIKATAARWRASKGIKPRAKKPPKQRPSIEELSKLFKNPDAAHHFRWLAENRK